MEVQHSDFPAVSLLAVSDSLRPSAEQKLPAHYDTSEHVS